MNENFHLYGTSEKPKKKELHKVGDFQFYYSDGEIEEIKYKSIELLRKISFLIRDKNWGTWSLHVDRYSGIEGKESVELHTYGYFSLDQKEKCLFETHIHIRKNRTLSISTTITPCNDIYTNRAGFILLHPLDGVCGQEVQITSNNKIHTSQFPYYIAPIQPFFNINKIRQNIKGIDLEIELHADRPFECEDQRNWTDASYKTYYRPLDDPFPYILIRDQSITQEIIINILSDCVDEAERIEVKESVVEENMPILYEHYDINRGNAENIVLTDRKIIKIDTTKTEWYAKSQILHTFQDTNELVIEVILPDDEERSDSILNKLSNILPSNTYVIPLPKSYLKSYQPTGDFPLLLTPSQALVIANRYFEKEFLGCGVLTYFTEFNRCGIASHLAGFIYHCNSATVHDADDASVMQTLESLPFIYESAQVKTGAYLPYRLGLSTIALQSNPYGDFIGENELNTRETMCSKDPRHRGLFGASWIVGFVATTLKHNLHSFCFSSMEGSFSSNENRHFYPIFHILKILAKASGRPRVLPPKIKNIALVYWEADGLMHGLVANLTTKNMNIHEEDLLVLDMQVAVLDKTRVEDASAEENFLTHVTKQASIHLTEYAVCYFQGALR